MQSGRIGRRSSLRPRLSIPLRRCSCWRRIAKPFLLPPQVFRESRSSVHHRSSKGGVSALVSARIGWRDMSATSSWIGQQFGQPDQIRAVPSTSARSGSSRRPEDLRAEQTPRRNRRAADAGIQAVELVGHVAQHAVDQRANGAGRMILGHALLGRHVTEHRIGLAVISSHAAKLYTRSMICRSLK